MTETNPFSPEFGTVADEHPLASDTRKHIARIVFAVFIVTFVASRVLVALIMARKIPDLYLHLGTESAGANSNHIHHLNYGIFLLSTVGAYLLFQRPSGRRLEWSAVIYAVGLALTFDEFGMWLHLGGGYWQRASFDAVVIIAAVLGLIAYAPSLNKFGPQHWVLTLVVGGAIAIFVVFVLLPLNRYATKIIPQLQQLEAKGPQ